MNIETHHDQFEPPSVIGIILRRLHIDIPLFICLVLVVALSLVILYSSGGQDMAVLERQTARIGLAFVLMTVLAHIDPYQFKRYSALLFGIGTFLLAAVLIMGKVALGAQRWLDLGFFRFQPSEMIKITTPMMIAWYLSGQSLPPKSKQFVVAVTLILV
ncbi:partial Peptidoglycan glycosyltransferase MrdB, partial [Patescibacteria group bacterium]